MHKHKLVIELESEFPVDAKSLKAVAKTIETEISSLNDDCGFVDTKEGDIFFENIKVKVSK